MENNKKIERKRKRPRVASPGPGKMPTDVRNASERYRNLKKSILIEELRDLLPPLPPDVSCRGRRNRVMPLEAVLRHATRYMKILNETLQASNTVHQTASLLMCNGEDALPFIVHETARLQKELDFKIRWGLIPTYGYYDPANKPYKGHEETLIETAEIYEKNRITSSSRQVDTLGISSNPASVLKRFSSHVQM